MQLHYETHGAGGAGRITNNWSGSTLRYWWTTRRFDRENYRARIRAAAAAAEPVEAAPASHAAPVRLSF